MGFGVPATIIMILAVVFLIRTYLKSQVKLKFWFNLFLCIYIFQIKEYIWTTKWTKSATSYLFNRISNWY